MELALELHDSKKAYSITVETLGMTLNSNSVPGGMKVDPIFIECLVT